jgi:pimeloyl-ACP methyl ester carboxylesterase
MTSKITNYFSRLLLLALLSLSILSCSDDKDPAPPQAEYLVSSTQLTEISFPEISDALAQIGITDFDNLIENPIMVYKITYNTVFMGDSIQASGLVVLPIGDENVPIVCAQHGTITAEDEAPSNFDALDGDLSFFELFSSGGFITFIPDFVGFGESSSLLHPYFIEDPYEQAIVDMIRAGVEFLDQQDVDFDPRLFLFGYSEGGYATLAVQDRIENDPELDLELNLFAVSAGAGGYLINAVADSIIQQPSFPEPAFLAFVFHAYVTYELIPGPLTTYFQEPYASRIPTLFNANFTIEEVNQQLTTDIDALFQPAFLQEFRAGTRTAVREAFEENSVADFAPKTQMRLYHSPEDEVIPPGTTFATADSLRANGATAPIEVLTNVRGEHFPAAIQTAARSLQWFTDIK